MVWRLNSLSKTVCGGVLASLLVCAAPAVPQTTSDSVQAELHPYVPPASASSSTAPARSRATEPLRESRPKEGNAKASAKESSADSSAATPRPVSPQPVTPKPETGATTSSSTAASSNTLKPVPPHIAAPPPAPAVTQTAAAPIPVNAQDIEIFTDSVVRTLMQRDHVLGVDVAIVQGNTPLLIKGYGYDRLNPLHRVDPASSLFRLGSISKVFTWIVARQEIEAGRIKPDASIGDYLPNDLYSEDRRFKPITLNELMAHTPGYEDTSLGHLFTLDGARIEAPDSYLRHHVPRRVREPGSFSSYSNYGTALAARALAQTAHAKDVPSLMEARVFGPLGMAHTSLREPYSSSSLDADELPAPLPAGLTQALSDGFVWDGVTYAPQPFEHVLPLAGALGASSTAQDMATFMAMMLAGGHAGDAAGGIQLFNADSARAFRTPLLRMPEGYNGWASGLMIRQAPSGEITYGHGGATLWFNANMVLVPRLNLGIFIAANTQTGAALTNSFPNLLLDHLNGNLVRPPLLPAADMGLSEHVAYYHAISGQYVSTRRAYGGLEGAVTRLFNTVSVSVDQDGRLILATPNGMSAFVPNGDNGFFVQQDAEDPGPAAETGGLHFLLPANGGKAGAFETASNLARYERIDWLHSPETLGWLSVVAVVICLMTLLALARPRPRHERPTSSQTAAAVVSVIAALLWLAAIFIFHNWRTSLANDPSALFTHWPSGSIRLASGFAFLAALASLYQLASLYFVLAGDARYGDGWSAWRKLGHTLATLWWLFYALVLMLWGALEPWSW